MTPTEFVEDGPTIRFLLSAEAAAAFDDITRDGQVRNLRGQSRRATGRISSARRG